MSLPPITLPLTPLRPSLPPGTGGPDGPDKAGGAAKPTGPGLLGGDLDPTPPADGGPTEPGDHPPRLAEPRPAAALPLVLGSLGSLGSLSSSIQEIAKVIQESNLQARQTARLDRQQARDADVQAQLDAAQKARDMANFNLAATVVSSAISIVGSAISIAGALKADQVRTDAKAEAKPLTLESDSLRATKGFGSDLDAAVKAPPTDARVIAEKQADLLSAKANRIFSIAEGDAVKIDKVHTAAGAATTEAGKIVGAALQRAGAEKDAERSELQAKASVARSKAEDQTDFIRAYADNVRAVLDKLSAIQQAEADTNRSINRSFG